MNDDTIYLQHEFDDLPEKPRRQGRVLEPADLRVRPYMILGAVHDEGFVATAGSVLVPLVRNGHFLAYQSGAPSNPTRGVLDLRAWRLVPAESDYVEALGGVALPAPGTRLTTYPARLVASDDLEVGNEYAICGPAVPSIPVQGIGIPFKILALARPFAAVVFPRIFGGAESRRRLDLRFVELMTVSADYVDALGGLVVPSP